MKKIVCILLSMFMTASVACAESITRTITSLGVNKSAVSVSIKDVQSGNTIYKLNERAPMTPASTLKVLTSSAALNTLGKDFLYSTKLYKSTNNDLYLKLSGDPLFTSGDLGVLVEAAKAKNISPKNFYIDDSVFDRNEWGEGWQWDDDLNPLMPKFSAYNIDKNLVKIEVSPSNDKTPASLVVKPFYPITFTNLVITDFSLPNNIKIDRDNAIAPNVLNISGVVSKIAYKVVPVANPKMNFILRLEETILNKKLEYFEPIKFAALPKTNVYLVSEMVHDMSSVLSNILKSSDNLTAETLFKTAGSVWARSQGNISNSLNMLEAYLNKIDLEHEDIKVVDGSGVSKNNIITADFMSDFLVYRASNDDFEDFMLMFPAPGEGTLKNRMLYFKDNLRAKTGTLSDTSAIAGYIKSRRGKLYAFDIMINDAKTSSADKKNVEEQILRNIYANY